MRLLPEKYDKEQYRLAEEYFDKNIEDMSLMEYVEKHASKGLLEALKERERQHEIDEKNGIIYN